MLKGLNEEEDIAEIKSSIETNENIKIVNITQLKTKHSMNKNTKLPIFVIQCSPDTNLTHIYKIKSLHHQKVTWEQLKKRNEIIQCFKCQRLGHVAANCNLDYRCVKCAEQHDPGECQIKEKIEDSNIYCVNCAKSGHPASFKGCPVYRNALERLRTKIKENQQRRTTPKVQSIPVSAENGTFATILKQTQQTNNVEIISLPVLANKVKQMAEMIKHQSEQIATLLELINKI